MGTLASKDTRWTGGSPSMSMYGSFSSALDRPGDFSRGEDGYLLYVRLVPFYAYGPGDLAHSPAGLYGSHSLRWTGGVLSGLAEDS